ncbi:hypothetical protein [Streptococcus suis]|uniref:Membrane protein n=1 Tax=Streptococcus suis TaxID=1307 RepID=A0AB33U6S8_STRSU|nr:hypothetical protein [Streptococcus suis]NQH14905.1 hypothetical protein [Streptococcus suis]NQH53361.1 hypothetical protein [Streptococcus suis]NQP13971.1 hypothetical protein [Streptococcus suis]NQR29755.1 hypothetical protein [Streptococcus suis]NQR37892.1 hypothetical protein [Streptococcus suis]
MIEDKENHFYFYQTNWYYKLDRSITYKLDKKKRENWKLAGITLVTAIITGWALDSILILGTMLASGLLFGFFVEEEEDL